MSPHSESLIDWTLSHACPRSKDIVNKWKRSGLSVVPLEVVADNIKDEGFNPKDFPDTFLTLLKVLYEGAAVEGDTALGKELTYNYVQRPSANDIVTSNIAVEQPICFPDPTNHLVFWPFLFYPYKLFECFAWTA